MKRKSILSLSIVAIAMAMASCTTSSGALNDLRNISSDINTYGSTYGIKEWKSTATRFYRTDKKVINYAKKGAYTDQEMQEISTLHGSCIRGFAKGAGSNVKGKIELATEMAADFLKALGGK